MEAQELTLYVLGERRRDLLWAGAWVAMGSALSSSVGARAAQVLVTRAPRRPALPRADFEIYLSLPPIGSEGLVEDGSGHLFVSNTRGTEIFRITQQGDAPLVTTWATGLQAPNGHKITSDGSHVVAQMGPPGALVRLDAQGRLKQTITQDSDGRGLVAPNDLAPDLATGGFYLSDPGVFGARMPGRVYYVRPDWVIDLAAPEGIVDFPNGLVRSLHGNSLLVAQGGQNNILEFPIKAPGKLGHPRVFAELPVVLSSWIPGDNPQPDGLTIDALGRVYAAQFGTGLLHVFDPGGRLLGSYDTGCDSISNMTFSNDSVARLYVTGQLGKSMNELSEARIVKLTLTEVGVSRRRSSLKVSMIWDRWS